MSFELFNINKKQGILRSHIGDVLWAVATPDYHNVKQKKVAAHCHSQIQQSGQGTYTSKFETVLSLNLTLCDKESRTTCFYIMLHKLT